MKPVAFDYARPASVPQAIALLFENPDAKVLAGGQTLGPMLNLRLAQPPVLVDITRIAARGVDGMPERAVDASSTKSATG